LNVYADDLCRASMPNRCHVARRERLDDLQLLDDRARPTVGDDQRKRVLVLGADVDEVVWETDLEPANGILSPLQLR
jgi:hypothetical protein